VLLHLGHMAHHFDHLLRACRPRAHALAAATRARPHPPAGPHATPASHLQHAAHARPAGHRPRAAACLRPSDTVGMICRLTRGENVSPPSGL
jgi:hypothetical protein